MTMIYERGAFFSEIKEGLFGSFNQGQVDGLSLILDEAEKRGTSLFNLSYILATTYHETATTMQPIKEYGGSKYLKSKKYYPYFGRGYVQLTWKDNYVKAGKKLGVDFVKFPHLLLKPIYAIPILFDGMLEGWFTGKKLGDYKGYYSSRKIINGLDDATLIASYADKFQVAIEHSIEQESFYPSPKVGHTKDGTPVWLAIIYFFIKLFRKNK